MIFADSQRQLWRIIWNQKIILLDQIFFQNLYCQFISEHFGHAWLNAKKITWTNHSFILKMIINYIQKNELYTSNSFCDTEIWKILAKSIFIYNLRKWFFLNVWFLENYKENYGASFKAKNSTSFEIFYKLQKALLLKIVEAYFFPWLCHYFILKTPKLYMKSHKNIFSCFWKKWFWLNWMTSWQCCFRRTSFA